MVVLLCHGPHMLMLQIGDSFDPEDPNSRWLMVASHFLPSVGYSIIFPGFWVVAHKQLREGVCNKFRRIFICCRETTKHCCARGNNQIVPMS